MFTRALEQALLMAAKDFRIFLKDRFAVAFALAFPLLFVLGFTLALGNVGPEDEALVLTVATREDSDGMSRQIIDSLISPPDAGFREMAYHDALAAVEDGSLEGFLAFPADFSASLVMGNRTELAVVASADKPFTEAALNGAARSIAGRVAMLQTTLGAISTLRSAEDSEMSELDVAVVVNAERPVRFETEQIGEIEPFNASNFTLPGYLTMFVFFAAAMRATLIARERDNQTLERLMSNGVGRHAVVMGKYLSAIYVALLQLVVLWTIGLLVFDIDLGEAPGAVILISVIMALTSAGFAVMLATIVTKEKAVDSAAVLLSLMLAPIGGSWWPLFVAPEWLQSLAKLTPHGWANAGFNKLMLFSADFSDVTLEMAALAAMGAVFIAVALWRFRLSG